MSPLSMQDVLWSSFRSTFGTLRKLLPHPLETANPTTPISPNSTHIQTHSLICQLYTDRPSHTNTLLLPACLSLPFPLMDFDILSFLRDLLGFRCHRPDPHLYSVYGGCHLSAIYLLPPTHCSHPPPSHCHLSLPHHPPSPTPRPAASTPPHPQICHPPQLLPSTHHLPAIYLPFICHLLAYFFLLFTSRYIYAIYFDPNRLVGGSYPRGYGLHRRLTLVVGFGGDL